MQMRRVDANLDKYIKRLDGSLINGHYTASGKGREREHSELTQATMTVMNHHITPESNSSVIIYTTCPICDIPHYDCQSIGKPTPKAFNLRFMSVEKFQRTAR